MRMAHGEWPFSALKRECTPPSRCFQVDLNDDTRIRMSFTSTDGNWTGTYSSVMSVHSYKVSTHDLQLFSPLILLMIS